MFTSKIDRCFGYATQIFAQSIGDNDNDKELLLEEGKERVSLKVRKSL